MNNYRKRFRLLLVVYFLGITSPNYATTVTIQEEQERPISYLLKLVPSLNTEELHQLRTYVHYIEGVKYRQGIEVTQDLKKSFEYTKEAADNGYPNAEYDLVVMYRYGKGAPESLEDSILYYTKASNNGVAAASN